MLPDKAISEFQAVYLQQVGEAIGFDEAKSKAENFLKLFQLITKKNKDEEFYTSTQRDSE